MIDATANGISSKRHSESGTNAGKRFKRWRYRHRQAIEAWIVLIPGLIYFSIFFLVPLFSSLAISFTKWSGLAGAPVWVGLDNYRRYASDPTYRQIVLNTLFFAVSTLLLSTGIAILVAFMLNAKVKARGLFRAAWYIPTLTSTAIMAQIMGLFIGPTDGIFTLVLQQLGFEPPIFYLEPTWLRLFIIVYTVWRGVGGGVILYLAALQGIHPEINEAAQIDGARAWQVMRYVTIPLLAPMTIFVLVTGIIGTAQIFEAVMFLSGGGPEKPTC
jgi:ABC-type sugar transport system permease subunit